MLKYNLPLSNTLYLNNLKSYLLLAHDNLRRFKDQNDDFTERMIKNETGAKWLEESSHLNNIEWLFMNSVFVTMYASMCLTKYFLP